MRLSYTSPFTLSLTISCAAAFILGYLTDGWTTAHLFSIGGSDSLAAAMTWARLLGHVLGHADSDHLIYNASLLLLLGPVLEERHGWARLLVLTVSTALVTGLVVVFLFPGRLLGASGVVFAFITLVSLTNRRGGTVPLTFVLVVLLFLGREVAQIIRHDHLAPVAHLLGGGVGGVFGAYWSRR